MWQFIDEVSIATFNNKRLGPSHITCYQPSSWRFSNVMSGPTLQDKINYSCWEFLSIQVLVYYSTYYSLLSLIKWKWKLTSDLRRSYEFPLPVNQLIRSMSVKRSSRSSSSSSSSPPFCTWGPVQILPVFPDISRAQSEEKWRSSCRA